jgi:uncharacterized membrane protein
MHPYSAILLVHIGAGSAALVASAVSLYAPKGGPLHRRAGRAFVAAMLAVGASALTLAVLRPSAFLFTVGLFSLYLVAAGWEAARPGPMRRRAATAALAMLVAAVCMTAIAGAAFLEWPGAAHLVGRLPPAALLTFAPIGAIFAVQDLRAWAAGGAEPHRRRVARHLARMGGAAIAAWTAFVVVNARFLPPPVAWIGPTLLLLPVILYWQRRVRDGRGAAAPHPS